MAKDFSESSGIQKGVAPGLYVVGSHICQSVLNTKILNFSPRIINIQQLPLELTAKAILH